METLVTYVGPLAFLDVLGYKSFVQSNDPKGLTFFGGKHDVEMTTGGRVHGVVQ